MAKSKVNHAERVKELAESVTASVIKAIEDGIAKGEKYVTPWNCYTVFPMNAVTGKPYQGMNALILSILFGGGYFAGAGQWKTKGAYVNKGEKALHILAPLKFKTTDKNGDEQWYVKGFKTVNIFRAEQVNGWDAPVVEPNLCFVDHKAAEDAVSYVINTLGADIRHGGDQAVCRQGGVWIDMPKKEQFNEESDYYATLFHECIHWTGKADRLNRRKAISEKFKGGKLAYAFEELVAELGAAMLCGELGVHNGYRDDHAHYIAGWLEIMKADTQAILSAAQYASKAVDVIMGRRKVTGEWIPQDQEDKKAA